MSTAPWSAPLAHHRLDATVPLPGSKSHTARALLLAAIADGPSRVRGALRSRDTDLMARSLEALGATIGTDGPNLHVTPMDAPRGGNTIDCGLAGTVMRFVPPLAALATTPTRFDGDAEARRRPLAPLLDALRRAGARIDFDGEEGFLPFTIAGPLRVRDHLISVDASASSQFLSALLLAAPLIAEAGEPLTVQAHGRIVSRPHIDMTVDALRARGVHVTEDTGADRVAWRIDAGRPRGIDVTIEPDLSNAGPFLGAALVAGGTVRVPDWPVSTTQAGDAWRTILTDMGARVTLRDGTLSVSGEGAGTYRGLDLDMSDIGELAPTLAALAVHADSPSRLRGIAHLRGHETDRLHALATEIRRLGGRVEEHEDGLSIHPVPLTGTVVDSWADHRMATFGALVGLALPGTAVRGIDATTKTLPDFPTLWAGMLGEEAAHGA